MTSGDAAGQQPSTSDQSGTPRAPVAAGFDPWIGLAFLPILAFLGVRELWGTQAAIGAGFGLTLIVFAVQRRQLRERRAIFWLAVLGLLLAAGGSIVGLILDSDKAYLAAGPVGDFVMVVVLAGSLALRRPLMGVVICEAFPRVREALRPDQRVFAIITALFVLENLGMGLVRLWMLDNFSVEGFVFWSRVVSWPLRIALVWFCYRLVTAAMRASLRDGSWTPSEPQPK